MKTGYTVKVEGDGLKQHGNGLGFGNTAGNQVTCHGCQPAGEGEQHAPGGGGGVNQESGLLVGNLQSIVDGAGNRAGNHAAQGTGSEDSQTQQPGEQVGTALGLDVTLVLNHHIDEAVNAALPKTGA